MTGDAIPQADPARRLLRFRGEIRTALDNVLRDGHLINGPRVEQFESAFAAYLGARHCVGVNSGTDALSLALRGLGVGPGDEVVTVALTAAGTAQAILHCGAQPRFVDVRAADRCMDPAAVEAAIGPRVRAIVPVHLFGQGADIVRLRAIADRHGLVLVEDCAQCHGASRDGGKLGTFGHAAAFSFYPTKNLGAVGDGGAVVTNDPALAKRVRALRSHGWESEHRISEQIGFNSRLDEVQAAILLALLPHLDAANRERAAIAARYRACLTMPDLALPPDLPGGVYHQFAATHPDRDGLRRHLARAGIGTAIHYAPGLHRHPAFREAASGPLPVTDRLAATLLSLPVQPEVAATEVERIVRAVLSFGAGR